MDTRVCFNMVRIPVTWSRKLGSNIQVNCTLEHFLRRESSLMYSACAHISGSRHPFVRRNVGATQAGPAHPQPAREANQWNWQNPRARGDKV